MRPLRYNLSGIALVCVSCFVMCSAAYLNEDERSTSRAKRVVHGLRLNSTEANYAVTQYVVWISDGHNCDLEVPQEIKDTFGLAQGYEINVPNLGLYTCDARKNHLECGGSLLTSTIVQTACHCVAHSMSSEPGMRWPVLLDTWENMFEIFSGGPLVSQLRGRAISKKYFHHPKCLYYHTVILYDYGLILLKEPLSPFAGKYAPIYSILDLSKHWKKIMAQMPMCLFIGFGRYLGDNIPLKTDILRHGWHAIRNYLDCYYNTNPGLTNYNYTRHASWFCTTPLWGELEIRSGHGDSGSPVSCNNEYTALVSQGGYLGRQGFWGRHMAIAFTPLENSIEYRQHLVNTMLSDQDYTATYNRFKYEPLPIYQDYARSSSFQANIRITKWQNVLCIFILGSL